MSYCNPGSAQDHAALPILSQSSLDLIVLNILLSVLLIKFQSPSVSTLLRKSFVTLIELLEFCPETVLYASESQSESYVLNLIDV